VTFAGRYAIVLVGCGASCGGAMVVGLGTSEVGGFPSGGEDSCDVPRTFTAASRPLRAGRREGRTTCVDAALVIEGLAWSLVDERRAPAAGGFC
jgi:hypothetical protein